MIFEESDEDTDEDCLNAGSVAAEAEALLAFSPIEACPNSGCVAYARDLIVYCSRLARYTPLETEFVLPTIYKPISC